MAKEMTSNQFDLLGDVDNDDPSQLIAAAEKKAAAAPKPAPAAAKPAAKLPTKPPPPGQAVEDGRNFRDGAGRGRGGRGGRNGPRRDYSDADANGFEGGYGGGGGGGVARGGEDGEGRGRGPRQPYRGGGGRRGGYTEGQTADEFGRPHRSYERRSGTGRGYGMKRDGAGRGNWGTATDEGLPQENGEAVNTEETAAVAEDEKKAEDAPQAEAEKVKEGAENEEEKEAEDKEMTLEEYGKVLEEKRKALLALKAEERKVEVDKDLQSMQQLSVKKDANEVFIKLGADKDLKKKENSEREERAKKSLNINEFLKPRLKARGTMALVAGGADVASGDVVSRVVGTTVVVPDDKLLLRRSKTRPSFRRSVGSEGAHSLCPDPTSSSSFTTNLSCQ